MQGRFGRGQRRGRRGRFQDDEEDDGALTLEEWEAQQAARRAGAAGGAGSVGAMTNGSSASAQQQQLSDEELARQLQRQLDLEAAAEWGHPPGQQQVRRLCLASGRVEIDATGLLLRTLLLIRQDACTTACLI